MHRQEDEIGDIVNRLLDNLSLCVSSQSGKPGADLRRQIGRVRGGYFELLINGGFGIALLTCFRLAFDANVKLNSLAHVRNQLLDEKPAKEIGSAIVQSAIMFCLSTESRIITRMTFVSREDCEVMMGKMKMAFDAARDKAADAIDSMAYQQLTFLAGALTNHLATASRPLPRMVAFHFARNFPALTASYRIYQVADRAEELVAENKIVHPGFCLRDMRGLNR
jgi:hypothetical protein